ncbi:MAG TPA: hypothetical protein VGX21_00170 [Methylomirabilota bacterium]|nr:hypothetical protein [Methylomirabilota bacterium]
MSRWAVTRVLGTSPPPSGWEGPGVRGVPNIAGQTVMLRVEAQ